MFTNTRNSGALNAVVASLPAEYRLYAVMRYYDGMTNREINQTMNWPDAETAIIDANLCSLVRRARQSRTSEFDYEN